jgi:hypothetical protein
VAHFAIGPQVVGTDQVAGIDLAAVDELVDLDGPRRFQRDVLELLLRDLDERVLVDRVPFDDVLAGDLIAGVGVDLEIEHETGHQGSHFGHRVLQRHQNLLGRRPSGCLATLRL